MEKIIRLILILLILPFAIFAQQKCNCEENFKWIKETFEKNDAGFQYALNEKGQEAYDKHNAAILKRVKKATTYEECTEIATDWLKFFRKSHLSVYIAPATGNAQGEQINWPTVQINEQHVRTEIPQQSTPGYEGIWTTGVYKIAIVKKDKGYQGIVLSTTGGKWKPNQVKFIINADSSSTYYLGNYSAYKFKKSALIGKNILHLGDFYLKRIYPEFVESDVLQLYTKEIIATNPFIQELSSQTTLLRIPSFDGQPGEQIDSLINANKTLLSTKRNLIIDIRNNGGGSDIYYKSIVPYLYTNPIRIIPVELYSTPLNNKRMEGYLSLDLSAKSRTNVTNALKTLNNNLGKFINFYSTLVNIQKLDSILPNPRQVAVIINEVNASTAEQFLLMAKQSKKVKLYGVTTSGILDISNTYTVNSPNKEVTLNYALSKSLRIPDMKIDNIGIQPDYFLDKSIPKEEWLNHVLEILEQ